MSDSPVHTHLSRSWPALVAACAANAGFLTFIESLRAHRSAFWHGATFRHYAGLFDAGLIYLGLLIAFSAFLLMLVRMVSRKAGSSLSAGVFVASFAGAVFWAGFAYLANGAYRSSDGAVAGVILSIPLMLAVLSLRTGASFIVLAVCMTSAWVAGIAAQTHAAHAFLYQLDIRADRLTKLAMVWSFGVFVFLTVVAGWASRRKTVARTMGALAAAGIVAAAVILPGPVFHRAVVLPSIPNAEGSNLVFVTCDALRADWMSAYGGPVPTPHADAMAQRGLRFERAYSLAPWTIPSMYGMFSSTYPPALSPGGTFEQWKQEVGLYRFPAEGPTLAEILRDKGYITAAFTGNPLLGDREGIMRGFSYTGSYPAHAPVRVSRWSQAPYLESLLMRYVPGVVDLRPVDSTAILTGMAEAFIRQAAGRPFFLWVHLLDPHDPYDPPARLRGPEKGPWPLFSPLAPYYGTPQLADDGSIAVEEEDKAFVRALYEGDIRYADEGLGAILEAVEAVGQTNQTFVALSADHGEELWDHGGYNHGQSLYDELVRVPLVLAGPGVGQGVAVAPVSTLDVMPTLSSLLHVEPNPAWIGEALGMDPEGPGRPVYALGTNRYAWPYTYQMVVEGRYKFIRRQPDGVVQLFELDSDPGEQHDIAAAQPAIVERYAALLDVWAAAHASDFSQLERPEADAGADGDLLEQIRSMGYVR